MTTDTEYVVNELLMFMFSKLNTDTSEDIIHVVDGFYGEEAVSDAKAILWGRYSLLATLGRNVSRRTKQKHVEDLQDAIRLVDSTYPDKSMMPYVFVARSMVNLPPSVKPATQPATDQPPAPTTCPLENRLHILESQMAELLKAATAEKSSRDVDCLDVTPGVATNGVRSYSEALDGSKPPQQIRDLSGMKAVGESSKAGKSAIDKDEQLPPRLNADSDGEWTTSTRRTRKGKAVYGKKQSDVLRAAPRRFEFVVFNITNDHGTESVRDYINNSDVNVLGIKTLTTPNATTDRLMFKVDVNYKDRDSVMDSDFWPENVGCREFYFKRKVEQTIVK